MRERGEGGLAATRARAEESAGREKAERTGSEPSSVSRERRPERRAATESERRACAKERTHQAVDSVRVLSSHRN